jgi:hypothetical protein
MAGCLGLLLAAAGRASDMPSLHLTAGADGVVLESGSRPGQRLRLQASTDLERWTEVAQVSDRLAAYADLRPGRGPAEFYRVVSSPSGSFDDWSNQLEAASSSLFRPGTGSGLGAIAAVKWSLRVAEPERVYFQDTVDYPYHVQFARARLPDFAGVGAVDFAAQSLYATTAQRLALGSVMRAPDPQLRELGIELTGADAFPAEQAAAWVAAVRRRLDLPAGWRVLYMPSVEQREETQAHLGAFASRGIEVSSLERWVSDHACYSIGWALGRLVHVPASQIASALADGRLRFEDILVTDAVPSELPVLAGYLALTPATPNSHVALLARSAQLPFAYANGPAIGSEITSLLGRDVLLVVEETDGHCRISLKDTTDLLSAERRREILDSKKRPLTVTPRALLGQLAVPADSLTPDDARYVGGKAAHFGILRRSLPDASPQPALAITFDLWDAFLRQPLAAGGTLQEFIHARLSRHQYPPHIVSLRTDLAQIREAVEKSADFTPAQRTWLLTTLQQAGLQGARIRFRSSTNLEDGDLFNGAGLYDSFSGCLEDDLDTDDRGPSRCDPTEPNERGVFRALRKVYASFYNENAVLERLRYGVDEDKVGMAVLVHFSTPDAFELANGVATMNVAVTPGLRTTRAQIVSQTGATSVTNPAAGVQAESVHATFTGPDASSAVFSLTAASSLTPAGDTVMSWLDDYRSLLTLLQTATASYQSETGITTDFELDFEFKKTLPGQLEVKQLRPLPRPVAIPVPTIP